MIQKVFLSYPSVYSSAGNTLVSLWNSVLKCDNSGLKKELFDNEVSINVGRINIPGLDEKTGFARRFFIIDSLCEEIRPLVEKAKKKYSSEKIGVFLGTSDHGSDYIQQLRNGENVVPNANYLSDHVHNYFQLQGPSATLISSCTSSGYAIIKATQFIQAGIIDFAIVGGLELISAYTLGGFISLENVASGHTNPFSKNRDGINMSEGAVLFCLSREKTDVRFSNSRKDIYIAGYGDAADAYHITAPHPEAVGAVSAMKSALVKAELKPEDINYVNLHGTGTYSNDKMESLAMAKIFGINTVPASTTKPVTGHTMGISSGLEIAICYAAFFESDDSRVYALPPQKWDGIYDDDLYRINFVSMSDYYKDWMKPLNYCMSLSFAFGGSNIAIVLGSDKV